MQPNTKRMSLDIYELISNTRRSRKFGLMFNLSKPYRCRNMQQVANLPFISSRLKEGQNEVYFKYRSDMGLHTVHMDQNPDMKTVIVALAKFIGPLDSKAVDPKTAA